MDIRTHEVAISSWLVASRRLDTFGQIVAFPACTRKTLFTSIAGDGDSD